MLSSHCGSRVRWFATTVAILAFGTSGCAAPRPGTPQPLSDIYKQAIASPMRTAQDREADARREPLEFLQFTGVQPGMTVLDVSAGDGYTTQLLALAVGAQGRVWAQTPKLRPALEQRLSNHPQDNIVLAVRPFDDPVPGDAPKLDLITLIFNYHDIAYLPVDRAKMNKRLFDALKPGGHLVVIDHSAKSGTGVSETKPLHRIDEAVVMDEVTQAGFRLEQGSDFFRNPDDPRDQRIFDMTIPVDAFALRFVKP